MEQKSENTTCPVGDSGELGPVGIVPVGAETPSMEFHCDGIIWPKEPEVTPFLSIKLNPEKIPEKFTRYRHPSHRHKLFMLTGLTSRKCDNLNCEKHIGRMDTIFSCFRCDFDLCANCFQLDTVNQVPLSPRDSEVNECTIKPLSENLTVAVQTEVVTKSDCC